MLEFKQEPFLKPFIKRNRNLQREAEKVTKSKNKMLN